ncbi:MAG: 3'-5' exonuclease [Bacteroidota bacterium]
MKQRSRHKLLDKIIIIDVESTCWKGKPPMGERSEIIEIGCCLLDVKTGELTENQGILVKPVNSRVSDFCTELTTLTQNQVDAGISFQAACRLLQEEYLSKNRVWASFGDYDRKQFGRQCEATGIPYPFGSRHLNVKTLCALKHGWDREVGMAMVLERLDLPLMGTHHRGVDDALNIAKILWTLLQERQS